MPGPRPSDAELFGPWASTWRRSGEQAFGGQGGGVGDPGGTRARRRVGRAVTRAARATMLIGQVLVHAGEQARAPHRGHRPGVAAAGGGEGHPDALAPVHEEPVAAPAVCLGRAARGLPGRGWATARIASGLTLTQWVGPCGRAWGGRPSGRGYRGELANGWFGSGSSKLLVASPGPLAPDGPGEAERATTTTCPSTSLGLLAEDQSEAARYYRTWGGPGSDPSRACSPGRSGSGAGPAAQ